MDILDDFFNLLCSFVRFMGFDPNNLGLLFQPLPERNNNIRHLSLIRRIGSRLPLLPARRIHIQNALLKSHERPPQDDSLLSEFSYVSTGGDNLVWIEEDLGNNCIMVRPRDKHMMDCQDTPDLHLDDLEDMTFDPGRGHHIERTSTPVEFSMAASNAASSVSAFASSTADPFTHQKITALEDELTTLRSQIALLIQEQEKVRIPAPTPLGWTDSSVGGCLPAPGCPPPAPPPPPPPPPPTPITGKFKAPVAGRTLADMIKENKAGLSAADTQCGVTKSTGPPSMADVLKGLGTVKLRTIQRSPGGTPLRSSKPKPIVERQDPAALIAEALKRKFASRVVYSPNTPDTDRETEVDDSPDSPAAAPFGQHVLKKTKKRSLLFQNVSPLTGRLNKSPVSPSLKRKLSEKVTSPLLIERTSTSDSPSGKRKLSERATSPLVTESASGNVDATRSSPSKQKRLSEKVCSPLLIDTSLDKHVLSPSMAQGDRNLLARAISPLFIEYSEQFHTSPAANRRFSDKTHSPLSVESPCVTKSTGTATQNASSPLLLEQKLSHSPRISLVESVKNFIGTTSVTSYELQASGDMVEDERVAVNGENTSSKAAGEQTQNGDGGKVFEIDLGAMGDVTNLVETDVDRQTVETPKKHIETVETPKKDIETVDTPKKDFETVESLQKDIKTVETPKKTKTHHVETLLKDMENDFRASVDEVVVNVDQESFEQDAKSEETLPKSVLKVDEIEAVASEMRIDGALGMDGQSDGQCVGQSDGQSDGDIADVCSDLVDEVMLERLVESVLAQAVDIASEVTSVTQVPGESSEITSVTQVPGESNEVSESGIFGRMSVTESNNSGGNVTASLSEMSTASSSSEMFTASSPSELSIASSSPEMFTASSSSDVSTACSSSDVSTTSSPLTDDLVTKNRPSSETSGNSSWCMLSDQSGDAEAGESETFTESTTPTLSSLETSGSNSVEASESATSTQSTS